MILALGEPGDVDVDRLRSPEAILDELGDPLDEDRYAWDRVTASPLGAEERFWLTYATQVEWGTEHYFATLDISRDPVVHRFLRAWLGQEVVHARLLHRFLEGAGTPVEPVHRAWRKRLAAWRGKRLNQVAHRALGDDFFAVHMAWGAVNELSTLRFYALIRAATGHPVLRDILRDLMGQEAAHYAFYRNVAIRRLADNARAQRLVRWALHRLWSPVGVGLRTRKDVDRCIAGVFGPRPEEVARMDTQLGRIPGLAGLDLARRSVQRATTRLNMAQ